LIEQLENVVGDPPVAGLIVDHPELRTVGNVVLVDNADAERRSLLEGGRPPCRGEFAPWPLIAVVAPIGIDVDLGEPNRGVRILRSYRRDPVGKVRDATAAAADGV
jgi:hypothetical protein